MSRRFPLTAAELEEHLQEQLGFLEASAEAYDHGRLGEAKRIAVVVRVLCHESRTSHALLSQLGGRKGQYLSTANPFEPTSISSHSGLISMGIGGKDDGYFPHLDDTPFLRWLNFDEWWSEVVIVDDRKNRLTRKDLVLTAANQDGGAHVDPALDERYARVTKENSLGWVAQTATGPRPIPHAEKASLRQIGHEILRTFRPEYRKTIPRETGIVAMGGMLFEASDMPPVPIQVRPGRNDLCPCGSGRKFKKCHGNAGTPRAGI